MSMSPLVVCNNILSRSFDEKIDISPMKLQKLLYFIACEYYKKTNSSLFSEPFEVWKYGPVLSSIYSEFKSYGKEPITAYAKDAKGNSYKINENVEPTLKASIDSIWNSFKGMNAIALSQITHKEGSAWSCAYENYSDVIDFRKMKEDTTYEEYIK